MHFALTASLLSFTTSIEAPCLDTVRVMWESEKEASNLGLVSGFSKYFGLLNCQLLANMWQSANSPIYNQKRSRDVIYSIDTIYAKK